MDVLRKLHLYMALTENHIYISRASEPTAQARALQASLQPRAALKARFAQVAAKEIDDMDKIIAQDPQNVPALNARCYMRAAMKTQLDVAEADCDKAVALRPRDDTILDSRAFLLYQQGKYPEALAAYNQVLAINAKSAPSLFMRGQAKGMLGDEAGKTADIQAATRAMPDIQRTFSQYDISLAAPG
jgi:tetratricopeptide (TPR) repeat protein